MRRASVLLEVLAAVAILVGSGAAILAAADRGERLLRRSRDQAHASDLARSVISAIEAGLITPQNAPAAVRGGPAGPAWLAIDEESGLPDAQSDGSRWRVEVQSEPGAWQGLALVTVQIFDARSAAAEPAFSLSQNVRLVPAGADEAGEKSITGPQRKPRPPAAPKGGRK